MAARQLSPQRPAWNAVAFQPVDGQLWIGTRFGEAIAVARHPVRELGRLDMQLRAAPLLEGFHGVEAQLEGQGGAAHLEGGA